MPTNHELALEIARLQERLKENQRLLMKAALKVEDIEKLDSAVQIQLDDIRKRHRLTQGRT